MGDPSHDRKGVARRLFRACMGSEVAVALTPEPVIARSALIVSLGSVASRVLGLVREQVIAGLFGASASTDINSSPGS